ncbi:hypothetical protein EDC94DRAFT_627091 [Helicostylum pulchrum]|nr:hypothetical protein EDC94DRAFT_627091 [Helicostylum pulchrum]
MQQLQSFILCPFSSITLYFLYIFVTIQQTNNKLVIISILYNPPPLFILFLLCFFMNPFLSLFSLYTNLFYFFLSSLATYVYISSSSSNFRITNK